MSILRYNFLAWSANGIPCIFLDALYFVGFVVLLAHPAKLVKTFCEALVTCAALTFVFEPRNIMIYCFHIRMFLIVRQCRSRKAPF